MTLAWETTGTENLLVSVDLGDLPSLALVSSQGLYLDAIYEECVQTEEAFLLAAEGNPKGDRHFNPTLSVKRMSIASPWQIVFTETLTRAPGFAIAAAASFGTLRAFRYLLDIKKDWDTHRQAMERGRVELDRLHADHATETVRQFYETLAVEHGISPPSLGGNADARLIENVRQLRTVTEVEAITDDDPRA